MKCFLILTWSLSCASSIGNYSDAECEAAQDGGISECGEYVSLLQTSLEHRPQIHHRSHHSQEDVQRKGWLTNLLHRFQRRQRGAKDEVILLAANHSAHGHQAMRITSAGFADYLVGFIYIVTLAILFLHELAVKMQVPSVGKGVSYFGFEPNTVLAFLLMLVPCYTFVMFSAVIATSYDLAIALDRGVAASGWIFSITFIGNIPGAIMARKYFNEEAGYCQKRARSGILIGACISNVSCILYAMALATISQADVLYWTLLILRFTLGLGCPFLYVIGGTMAYRAIPTSYRTIFAVANNTAKNLGLILGPILGCIALQLRLCIIAPGLPADQQTVATAMNAVEMSFWPAVATCYWGVTFVYLLARAMPVELDQVTESEDAARFPAVKIKENTEPEDLSEEGKYAMYRVSLLYQIERALTIAAIEVSTLMLLETEYQTSVVESSYLFSGVSSASTLIMVVCVGFMNTGFISESSLCMFAIVASTIGGGLFFNFGGVKTLLAADFLVYGFSGISLGILEGWGTRAAMSSAHLTQTRWRSQAAVFGSIMRLISPPLARVIVQSGGRNAYALAQSPIVLMGLLTTVKACSLLWKKGERSAPDGLEKDSARFSSDGSINSVDSSVATK